MSHQGLAFSFFVVFSLFPKKQNDEMSKSTGSGETSAGSASTATGGPGQDRDRPSGIFDAETGALSREFDDFLPKKKRRGYGETPDMDDHPFLRPGISVVIAPTGGGKTTLQLNLLEEILNHVDPDRLGRVMMYTGSPQDDLLKHVNRDLVDVYGPETVESFLNELRDLQTEQIGEHSEQDKPFNVLVLDDAGNDRTLTPSQSKGTEIGDVYMRHRHLRMHIIASAQRWMMLPPFLRSNLSHLFLFPGKSKTELNEIFRNIDLPIDQLTKSMQSLSAKPHQFLWVDLPHRTAKIGFNKVVLR